MNMIRIAALAVCSLGVSSADILFQEGNVGSLDDSLVFFDNKVESSDFIGELKDKNDMNLADVRFTSTNVVAQEGSGQAKIQPVGDALFFTDLDFSLLDNMSFTSVVFSVKGETGEKFTVNLDGNNLMPGEETQTGTFSSGNQFFTIIASNGQTINKVSLSGEFQQVAQIRIGGQQDMPPGGEPIPEPATYLLIGAGLSAVAMLRHRRA